MNERPLRVIKLGGSLLQLPGLRDKLQSWLQRQTPAVTVLLAGGGLSADAIRAADRVHGLTEEAAHWLCIRAMSLNAHLVVELLPGTVLVDDIAAIRRQASTASVTVLDPWRFLREDEPPLNRASLPHSWDVTSDSIAARLAEVLAADELVLLKSALPAVEPQLALLAKSGFVDAYFSTAAAQLRSIRMVDLAGDGFPEVVVRVNCIQLPGSQANSGTREVSESES